MLQFVAQTPTSAPPTEVTTYVAIGFGILALAYLFMRGRAKKRDPLENQGSRFSLAQQRSLERDMNNLVVELSEMARQITAQLDTRAAKLEMLIKEADDRLARLEHLQAHPTHTPAVTSTPAPASLPALVEPPPPPPPDPVDPRHAEVYTLADQGHSSHAIAQHLGRPSGEIELILALRSTSRVS